MEHPRPLQVCTNVCIIFAHTGARVIIIYRGLLYNKSRPLHFAIYLYSSQEPVGCAAGQRHGRGCQVPEEEGEGWQPRCSSHREGARSEDFCTEFIQFTIFLYVAHE